MRFAAYIARFFGRRPSPRPTLAEVRAEVCAEVEAGISTLEANRAALREENLARIEATYTR